MNLIELLQHTAGQCPHKAALIDGTEEVSYRALLDDVSNLAIQLQNQGVAAGMRIGLCLPNSVPYVTLTFALWKAGAVVVPVPIECTEEDIEEISRSMELDALLTAKHGAERSEKIAGRAEYYFTRIAQPRPTD